MVAPVKGPFQKSLKTYGTGAYNSSSVWGTKDQTWYTQAKPYDLPLSYQMTSAEVKPTVRTDFVTYNSTFAHPPSAEMQSVSARVYAAAFARYISALKEEQSAILAGLAEYQGSRDMIIKRVGALYQGLRAAKRGDVQTLKRIWGKNAGVRPRLRATGGHVLEYSFGWAPLVDDISGAVDVFKKGIPPSFIKVSKSFDIKSDTPYIFDSPYTGYVSGSKSSTHYGWSLRSKIRVTDPNLLLANSLGLINPVSVGWELVPFSFVVDYFVNVGDYLNSFTDRLGIEEIGASATFFVTRASSGYRINTGSWLSKGYHNQWSGSYVSVNRGLGIPRPQLVLRLPWRLSMGRAATSVALLVQFLKGK